jgi:16S rRNA (cytosine967-C5)-methyltransferase
VVVNAPTARDLAAHVLVRVVRDEAFAAAALEAELSRAAQLDPRDRALATELVYGTLRVLPFLEAELDARARRGKGTASLPWEARAALWVAVQQIFFMRVPAFAAVDEAVSAVKRAGGRHMAGFANAILRKIAAAPKPDRASAVARSCPPELRAALERALGEEGGRSFLSETEPPPVDLRVRTPGERDAVLRRLREALPNADLRAGRVSPLCIEARGLGVKPQSLPGWDDGEISIQEEGSQLVALSVGAKPGERVLDACAGRGNKTGVLALSGARVDACDSDPRKLERLRDDLARFGVAPHATYAVDWTVGSGEVTGLYDAVLVDAPCSGIGTLRRRPEIALRPRALGERTKTQVAIARAAAAHVAPGGRFVYAVCSVLREEAEDVVAALGGADLEPAPFADATTTTIAEGATALRLLPYIHGTDGYFLASFRKR